MSHQKNVAVLIELIVEALRLGLIQAREAGMDVNCQATTPHYRTKVNTIEFHLTDKDGHTQVIPLTY